MLLSSTFSTHTEASTPPPPTLIVHPAFDPSFNVTATPVPEVQVTAPFTTHSAQSIMLTATLIALLATHGYTVVRAVVRHILESALWKGSEEERIVAERELEVREERVKNVSMKNGSPTAVDAKKSQGVDSSVATKRGLVTSESFWTDQGMDEITNAAKLE